MNGATAELDDTLGAELTLEGESGHELAVAEVGGHEPAGREVGDPELSGAEVVGHDDGTTDETKLAELEGGCPAEDAGAPELLATQLLAGQLEDAGLGGKDAAFELDCGPPLVTWISEEDDREAHSDVLTAPQTLERALLYVPTVLFI
jgi:hypothetical protein